MECKFQLKLNEHDGVMDVLTSNYHNHDQKCEDIGGTLHGKEINSLLKIQIDEFIRLGLSNYKILEQLEKLNIAEEVLPDHKQLSNRRFYLKNKILQELKDYSKGPFTKWVEKHEVNISNCDEHDF